MKIGAFISSIITFIIAAVATYVVYNFTNGAEGDEWAGLATVILLPIVLIICVILAGTLIGTLITSINGAFSQITAIKVICIIILALTVGLIVFNAIHGVNAYNKIFIK